MRFVGWAAFLFLSVTRTQPLLFTHDHHTPLVESSGLTGGVGNTELDNAPHHADARTRRLTTYEIISSGSSASYITSGTDCQTAANNLGSSYIYSSTGRYSSDYYPYSCYYKPNNAGANVFFNSLTSSTTCCNSERNCVCLLPSPTSAPIPTPTPTRTPVVDVVLILTGIDCSGFNESVYDQAADDRLVRVE